MPSPRADDGGGMHDAEAASARLQVALAARGLLSRVEACGRLAIVVPSADSGDVDVALRRWLVRAAEREGFTHVALEIGPPVHASDAVLGETRGGATDG